ncbi:MAG TPA: ketopantoate reductase family protein [Spirochaetia bacterium]|nr:ketopantoate reductase family protein [Spirochaetia bacterium]
MESTSGGIAGALIVGAGAIGTAVAGTIADHDPAAVSILATGERFARYRGEGFILNGVRMDFPLASPPQCGDADLIIVAVKNHHLEEAIREMQPVVGPHTLIISLLNGISSEDSLGAAFGREKVLYAMILGIDAVREANATRFSTGGVIHFGDAHNQEGAWSPRVSRIASFFSRVGVAFNVPSDMVRSLWYKFMINVGINQVSTIISGTYGLFQKDTHAQSVMEAAMAEVVAVSRAAGTGLEDADIKAWYKTLRTLAPEGKTSMLQDVEAGRETEVEAFAGTIIRLGRETGTPVPVNQTLYWLLKAKSP